MPEVLNNQMFVFAITNNWAGESIAIREMGEKYIVTHTVFGSGVPIVSQKEYSIPKNIKNIRSQTKYHFDIHEGETILKYSFVLLDNECHLYLFGKRLGISQLIGKSPNKPLKQ
jgi:hypothetical protein